MEKVIIYGAGGLGSFIWEKYKDTYDILCFVDSEASKQGMIVKGLPVYHPEKLAMLEFDYIAICCGTSASHIKEDLQSKYSIPGQKIMSKLVESSDFARETTLLLMSKIIYEKGLQGSVAELGVFEGKFAKEINRAFKDRKLYLFDTFKGFDERDFGAETGGQIHPATYLSKTSEEKVLGTMPYPEKCIVKKGYFPDTAAGIKDNFVYVNLDPDLYKPMIEGLRFFYPKLQTGGFIMIHDYFNEFFKGASQAVVDYEKEIECILPKIPIGDGMSVAIVKL